jgi:TatD DNase family protein
MVDIGANLAHRDLFQDLLGILNRSKEQSVNDIIITGTSIKSSKQAVSIVSKHDQAQTGVSLYSTVGIHPHDASTFQ